MLTIDEKVKRKNTQTKPGLNLIWANSDWPSINAFHFKAGWMLKFGGSHCFETFLYNPKLDTRISVLRPLSFVLCVSCSRYPPPPWILKRGELHGELWSKTNLLIWQNEGNSIFSSSFSFLLSNKKYIPNCHFFLMGFVEIFFRFFVPKLDTLISVLGPSCVTLTVPPLDYETS